MNTEEIPSYHADLILELLKPADEVLSGLSEPDIDILHAAVGVSTEAAELLEAVLPVRHSAAYYMTGPDHLGWLGTGNSPGIDVENIKEELGDHLFYEGALRLTMGLECLGGFVGGVAPPQWQFPLPPAERAKMPFVAPKQVLCELAEMHSVLSGKILDVAKKIVFYRQWEKGGRPLKDRMGELLAYDCWVTSAMAGLVGLDEEAIRRHNIHKLKGSASARYKDGYSDEAAQARADKKGGEE